MAKKRRGRQLGPLAAVRAGARAIRARSNVRRLGLGKKSHADLSPKRRNNAMDLALAESFVGEGKSPDKDAASSETTRPADVEATRFFGPHSSADSAASFSRDAADGYGSPSAKPPSGDQVTDHQAPQSLESLAAPELSATYGRGYELLCRMGYGGGGLRADSLQAPLRPHNHGKSRRGLGMEAVVHAPVCSAVNAAAGAGDDMQTLLRSVLSSMQQAGDEEEAAELSLLAASIGNLETLGEPAPKRQRRRCDVLSATYEKERCSGIPSNLVTTLLESLRSDDSFPVELGPQAHKLRWKQKWQDEFGTYEEFLEMHKTLFRVISCPRPHGPLVLPRDHLGSGAQRYVAWCHARRVDASGKEKRKWKHIESLVQRVCRESVETSRPEELLDVPDSERSLPTGCQSSSPAVLDEVSPERSAILDPDSEDACHAISWYEDTLGSTASNFV